MHPKHRANQVEQICFYFLPTTTSTFKLTMHTRPRDMGCASATTAAPLCSKNKQMERATRGGNPAPTLLREAPGIQTYITHTQARLASYTQPRKATEKARGWGPRLMDATPNTFRPPRHTNTRPQTTSKALARPNTLRQVSTQHINAHATAAWCLCVHANPLSSPCTLSCSHSSLKRFQRTKERKARMGRDEERKAKTHTAHTHATTWQ